MWSPITLSGKIPSKKQKVFLRIRILLRWQIVSVRVVNKSITE